MPAYGKKPGITKLIEKENRHLTDQSNGIDNINEKNSRFPAPEGATPFEGCSDFYWQSGYAAFSVSQSSSSRVIQYIENQEQHHRKMSFQDEIRELCRKHGVEIDEQYMWD